MSASQRTTTSTSSGRGVTSHTNHTTATSTSTGGSSGVGGVVAGSSVRHSSNKTETSAAAASSLASHYLNTDPLTLYATSRPAPVKKTSSSSYLHKDVTWSEVTPSASRTSNISERHNTSAVRFDALPPSSAARVYADILAPPPPKVTSEPTARVTYETRDYSARTHTRPTRFP